MKSFECAESGPGPRHSVKTDN